MIEAKRLIASSWNVYGLGGVARSVTWLPVHYSFFFLWLFRSPDWIENYSIIDVVYKSGVSTSKAAGGYQRCLATHIPVFSGSYPGVVGEVRAV